MPARRLLATLAALTAAVSACGTSSSSGAGATGSPTGAAAASATPATSSAMTVWVVTTAAGQVVRVSTGGGAFHTLVTLPTGAVAQGAGGHTLLATYADGHLHGINLLTGAATDYGGGTDFIFWGAAFAPDGHRAAYVRASMSSPSTLRVLDVNTGGVTALRTFSGNLYDVPVVWNATAMGSFGLVGYADAGPQGVSSLNPADGTRTAHTESGGGGGPAIAYDAVHAADNTHSALGDDADATGGPGPQGPFNTLRTITIGSAPVNVLQEAHHNISPLGLSPDGSTIVFFDDSAAGGFAGISESPDFGLFTWSAGHKTQLSHYGTRWDAVAFTDASAFVAAKHEGSTESLVNVSGTTLTPLDTVAGDGPAVVYSVSG